jgi:dienelactone hydrolase
MKIKTVAASVALLCIFYSIASAEIKSQKIEYQVGDATMLGYLAYDDASNAKRPAVIVVHEWWGNNDYSRHRAEQLAQLGYVGFAIDMYGKGKTTDDVKQAQQWSGEIHSNPDLASQRIKAAMVILDTWPTVDTNKIAAIGYCFGGSVVLNMARQHMPILGVVAFHGDLSNEHPEQTKDVKAKILVCHGADDPLVNEQAVSKFIDEMKSAGADWQLIQYSGAQHAFTNPAADSHHISGIAYNKEADERSWKLMQDFLSDLFK